jgi:hypothetical protein
MKAVKKGEKFVIINDDPETKTLDKIMEAINRIEKALKLEKTSFKEGDKDETV